MFLAAILSQWSCKTSKNKNRSTRLEDTKDTTPEILVVMVYLPGELIAGVLPHRQHNKEPRELVEVMIFGCHIGLVVGDCHTSLLESRWSNHCKESSKRILTLFSWKQCDTYANHCYSWMWECWCDEVKYLLGTATMIALPFLIFWGRACQTQCMQG
jgi:hypothetical protein